MHQALAMDVDQVRVSPQDVGADDGLSDISDLEGPLERLGAQPKRNGAGPKGGNGGSVGGNQRLTMGGMASIPAGGWQDGQLGPSVHQEVSPRSPVVDLEER